MILKETCVTYSIRTLYYRGHPLTTLTSKGGEGSPNVNDTTSAYSVNLTTMRGGGQKPQNSSNVLVYGCPHNINI